MNAYANRRFAHKQPVYIKFRQQINISKNPQPCRPLVKGGGFRKKTGGIGFDEEWTFIKQPVLQANLQPNIIYNQNVPNLSVSYADSSLYQREPCYSFGLKC